MVTLRSHESRQALVAEQFGTLEAICPRRIDLGRAPGGDFQIMRVATRFAMTEYDPDSTWQRVD